MAHRPVPGCLRNTFFERAGAKTLTPSVEAGWQREGYDRLREQCADTGASAQDCPAGKAGDRRIELFHLASLTVQQAWAKKELLDPADAAKSGGGSI